MTPNIVDIPSPEEPENASEKATSKPTAIESETRTLSILGVFLTTLNALVHILTGIIVGVTLIFSLRMNPGTTRTHIITCTIGYQLLMTQSILALCPQNTWSTSLSLVTKRRVHWVLQILGAVLVIWGSIIMSLDKAVNWNTLHGQFALVALVFTVVSLVNGLASLYAYELRKCIPGILSKLTHICFGTVAFTAACVSLCYGFDKNSFRNWTSPELALVMIGITGVFNVIIIISPLLAFSDKFVTTIKNRLC